MAFTTPTTRRVASSGSGRLWADMDSGTHTLNTSYYPNGGQGAITSTAASADPFYSNNWIVFFGFSIIEAPALDTTITVEDGTGSKSFVYIVDATAVAGNYFPAQFFGLAAHPGAIPSGTAHGGQTFTNPGIMLKGLRFEHDGDDNLRIRLWFRHETSF